MSIKEINDIDIKTCKILIMAGSLHPNRDVNKLYINRKEKRGWKRLKVRTNFV